MAIDLKAEFSSSLLADNTNQRSSITKDLMKAIEDRQETMKKRFETMIQYKVNIFFDEAPTVASDE